MFKRKPKHEHEWEIVSAQYRHPLFETLKGTNEQLLREAMYGVTLVNQKCSGCGTLTQQRLLGQVHIPGFTWRDKK